MRTNMDFSSWKKWYEDEKCSLSCATFFCLAEKSSEYNDFIVQSFCLFSGSFNVSNF